MPDYSPETLAKRFAAKVLAAPPDICHIWTGGTTGGYGRFRVGWDTVTGAHRYAYEVEHGPIPEGMVVMHTCDNPPCVNVRHLRLGTHADNVADREAKGRGVRRQGTWPDLRWDVA